MHRLDFRRLVFIGDSIALNQKQSLVNLLGVSQEVRCAQNGAAHNFTIEYIAIRAPGAWTDFLSAWTADGRPTTLPTEGHFNRSRFNVPSLATPADLLPSLFSVVDVLRDEHAE